MIRVRIRSKRFGASEVLGPVAFEIAPGECLAVLGPSGIGKSTLLRIVAGIDDDYDGEVDRPVRAAIVFQEPTLLPWRSALRNLTIVHPDLSADAARAMLTRVGIGDKGEFYPGQLSLGQQRRLALARAFAGSPDFLVMDEPFASLDPATAETMIALTETLMADTAPATLFVTHARAEAERLATRIVHLQGAPATLKEKGSSDETHYDDGRPGGPRAAGCGA